jgi:hypothetical protein
MPCIANYSSTTASLEIETWSGLSKVNGKPQKICTIDDTTEAAYHFAEIQNFKTYDRHLTVKGIIAARSNRAKFQGPFIVTEREWEEVKTVYHSPGTDIATFDCSEIVKKVKGQETIKTEVEYEDSWNPGVKKRADDPAKAVVFSITVS